MTPAPPNPVSTTPAVAPPGGAGAVCLGLLLLLLLPGLASAQSVLGSSGLGFPLEPIDARARGMGSLGIGLFGPSLLPGDPAVAQSLRVPMVTATFQPSRITRTVQGVQEETTTSRFPLIGIAYPLGETGSMLTLTFSGFLDQTWEVLRRSTVRLGDVVVPITDRFRSDGGVSVLRAGWSHALREDLAIGITVGTYLGDVERSFRRSFDPAAVGDTVETVETRGEWRYTGPTVSVGASWDPVEVVRVAGTVIWSGNLSAEPKEGTVESGGNFDIPLQLRLGSSLRLTPRLSANVGVDVADWGTTGDDLEVDTSAGTTWSFGGGLEWDGPTLLDRNFPIRIGYRKRDLPFRFGEAAPSESAFAAGLGLNFLQVEDLPLARVDLAVELGDREAGPFEENFTRWTITVRVAGN